MATKHLLAESVVLDSADGRVAEHLSGEDATTDPSEQVQLSHSAFMILERNAAKSCSISIVPIGRRFSFSTNTGSSVS